MICAKNLAGRQTTRLSKPTQFETLVCDEGDFAACCHTNVEAKQAVNSYFETIS